MEHARKVLERVVDKGLSKITDIEGMQFGFMKGHGTTYVIIWLVRQTQEKMLQQNNNPYCAFVDLEKTFDGHLPRQVTYLVPRE